MSLRQKRYYKPYSLRLEEFRFDRFPGSNKAKNFSSRVRLIHPEQQIDREVVIWVNNPLYHRRETFFQAGFDKGTEQGTVLQVVRKPGWRLPYVSCMMVGVGMAVHFLTHLCGFLGARAKARPQYFHWLAVAAGGAYLVVAAIPSTPGNGEMDLRLF